MTVFWITLAVWFIGFVATVKLLAEDSLEASLQDDIDALDQRKHDYPNLYEKEYPEGHGNQVPTAFGRRRAARHGVARAIVWPASLSMMFLTRSVVSPTERRRAAEQELARVRKLAEDAGINPEWLKDWQ